MDNVPNDFILALMSNIKDDQKNSYNEDDGIVG